jgi:hypothetical protein
MEGALLGFAHEPYFGKKRKKRKNPRKPQEKPPTREYRGLKKVF